jgi:hypothetical protein
VRLIMSRASNPFSDDCANLRVKLQTVSTWQAFVCFISNDMRAVDTVLPV